MPRARKIAGTAGKIALAATGVGAVALGAAALQKRKAQKKVYTIDRWGPVESNPSLVAIHYTPAIALAKSDRVTITGTPFDGEYKPTKAPTRNDIQITPSAPVTTSGTTGTFKVKTGTVARLKGALGATKAGVRTGLKKTAGLAGKGLSMLWNKIKWYVIGLAVAGVLFMLLKSYIIAKATAPAAPAPAPVVYAAPPTA
jgi:hypothetical protein